VKFAEKSTGILVDFFPQQNLQEYLGIFSQQNLQEYLRIFFRSKIYRNTCGFFFAAK
jgi:hypothetical protein